MDTYIQNQVYDPATDKWARVAPMKKMCGFVGGVLVERPIHFEPKDSKADLKMGLLLDF